MAGKAKFNQEAALQNMVRAGQVSAAEGPIKAVVGSKNKDRVQRSYFLDRDIDKALRRMALEEERNLTETVNDLLRRGLEEYLK
ncbi:hypothetical protein [Clostridium phoceensis]|uniref:hypothetical protein n=1 Tax=Clostridium phoceensis TaxID=1650661 RepID=UPI00067ED495|nr:hypothetical protein [Clostridium phoceensis]